MIRYAHDFYPSWCAALDLCCTRLSCNKAVRDNVTVRPKQLTGSASSHHSVSAFDRFKSVQNSTLGARDVSAFRNSQVSAFPSGRAHQNTHKIEGIVISCPHFRVSVFLRCPQGQVRLYIFVSMGSPFGPAWAPVNAQRANVTPAE